MDVRILSADSRRVIRLVSEKVGKEENRCPRGRISVASVILSRCHHGTSLSIVSVEASMTDVGVGRCVLAPPLHRPKSWKRKPPGVLRLVRIDASLGMRRYA